MEQEPSTTQRDAPIAQDDDAALDQVLESIQEGDGVSFSDSDDDDNSEYHDSESNQFEQVDSEDEFADAEFKELVSSEGPQEMLRLMLQEQADEIMTEEVEEGDDYADWIRWVSDAEKSRQAMRNVPAPQLSHRHSLGHDSALPVLLQTIQIENNHSECQSSMKPASFNPLALNVRWKEICERIKIDTNLGEHGQQQLWAMLGRYQDVFAWNKGELGYYTIGEHNIDTQGFPPCKASPGRLSYWEETEVKRQIDALVDLGKMRPSNSEYACRVTLPVKKDGSRRFCGDYRPLNAQTRRDMFPMPFVEDVIDQLGKSTWFTALDLQSGFWQI